MYPCDHSVGLMSMISWTADEGMLSPSQFFHLCLSSPCRLQNPRGVLHSGVLMSWPGFWWKNKGISVSYFYREHMVYIYFVIGFYHLVERCYCIWSERSLPPHHFTAPSGFFTWVTDLGSTSTRLPGKYFLSRRWLCIFFIWNSTFFLPMVMLSCSK